MFSPPPQGASQLFSKYQTKSISPPRSTYPRTPSVQPPLPQWYPWAFSSHIIITSYSNSSRINIKFKISNLIKAVKLMKEFKFNNSSMWRQIWHIPIKITWCKVNNQWEATKLHICLKVLPTFIPSSIFSIIWVPLVSQTQLSSNSICNMTSINKLSNIAKSWGSERLFTLKEVSPNSSTSSNFISRIRSKTTLHRTSSTSSITTSNLDYSNKGIRLSLPPAAAIRYNIKYWLQ